MTSRITAMSLVLTAVLAAVACSPRGPKPILSEPPAPAVTGSAVPFSPVSGPVDLTSFKADPCRYLDREQIAALIVDPPRPNNFSAFKEKDHVACSWSEWGGPMLQVTVWNKPDSDLPSLRSFRDKNPGKIVDWRELSLAGLPVVEYKNAWDVKSCEVAVGVSDDEMLEFRYNLNTARTPYWENNECGGALKAAEFVIGNLRNG